MTIAKTTPTPETPNALVPWTIYVVEADSSRSYGALHTVTASHLLTQRPGPGDRIVAVLHGQRELAADGRGGYECVAASLRWGDDRGFRLTRTAGRSAMLGEDGLEDAFGGDAIDQLVPEILRGDAWTYAPVEIEWEPEDGPEPWRPELRRWQRVASTHSPRVAYRRSR